MATVRVNLGDRSYDIEIGSGILDSLGPLLKKAVPRATRALVIGDANTGPLYGDSAVSSLREAGIAASMVTVPAGEQSKSLQTAGQLYDDCLNAGLERSSAIVALGGGVVGDLAGFVAATYLRGLPYVQVPTTVQAQVDASVGGKVAVDLPGGKNLVGAFHQPRLVVADVATLSSLPRRQVSSGLAEVVKHGVIQDPPFFDFLEESAKRVLALDPSLLGQVIERNCRIKGFVVEADETESGLRAILNYGHTVGHAIEALRWESMLHGECVAIGMVAAARIALAAGVLTDAAFIPRLVALLDRLRLPVRLPVAPAELLPVMYRDKKVDAGRIRWVLPVRMGEVTVQPVDDSLVLEALQRWQAE